MLSAIYRHLFIPLFESGLKRRATLRHLRQLDLSQWRSRDELKQMQLESLRLMLAHAATHCPYYRERWRALGLDPLRLDNLDQFRTWPTTDRNTITEHRASIRSTLPQLKLLTKETGGSSGVPLQFDLDTGSNDWRTAAAYRGYAWAGAALGTRQLHLWGIPLTNHSSLRRFKAYLQDRWLYRRLMLNTFDLGPQRNDYFFRQINRFRPQIIVAYTGPLYCLARAFEEQQSRPYPPQAIIVGAEKLHDFQRELIQSVFRAPVFETYGSREFMLIGAECERHEGLHLTVENLLVEITDDHGQPVPEGVEGHVVITDLHNYGAPFVRYRIGDRAIGGWETCSCGRGLPLLRQVVGRQLDVLQTSDGRRIPGEFFPHLIKDFAHVQRFQVVQDRIDSIELTLVAGPEWTDCQAEALCRTVREHLGPAVQFQLRRVDHIPVTSAGKHQVVVNRCRPTADHPPLHKSSQSVTGA